MIAYADIFDVPAGGPPRAVAIGVFDGLHLGHQAIVKQVVRAGEGWRPAVVTFDRHPAAVLQPEAEPPYLATDAEQRRLIEALGVEDLIAARLDSGILKMEPEAFAQEVLAARLQACAVFVGEGFRFGRNRRGDLDLLHRMGAALGFGTTAVPLLMDEGAPISSTRARSLLGTGDVSAAARLLGRPYSITGPVVAGRGMGRGLGVPTANVRPPDGQMLPANGVYAVRCAWDGDRGDGVLNLGVRPTFGIQSLAMEVHLLSPPPDLYGRDLRVDFVERLRDERHFDSTKALVKQILADVDAARSVLRAAQRGPG